MQQVDGVALPADFVLGTLRYGCNLRSMRAEVSYGSDIRDCNAIDNSLFSELSIERHRHGLVGNLLPCVEIGNTATRERSVLI